MDAASPADIVNLVSMVVLVFGVFVVPILGFFDPSFSEYAFGLAMLLFVGYPFAIAGHYDMCSNQVFRSYSYFPRQEKIIISVIALSAVAYVIAAPVGQ